MHTHALLCLGAALFPIVRMLLRGSPDRALRWSYVLLAGCLLLPHAVDLIPESFTWTPTNPLWNDVAANERMPLASITAPSRRAVEALTATVPADLSWLLLALSTAWLAISLVRAFRTLSKTIGRTFPFKRFRNVEIRFSDDTTIPFAAGVFKRRVIIPTALATKRHRLRLIVAHELQHHRGGDVLASWLLEALRAFCFFNPFVRVWTSAIFDLQEISCDANLIGRRGIAAREYGRCLWEVAHHDVGNRFRPVGTAGLGTGSPPSKLRKRITMILNPPKSYRSAVQTASALVALGTLALGALALAGDGSRTFTLAQARTLASAGTAKSGFPVRVNDRVLEQLNHFAGTRRGRKYVREAMERLREYRPLLNKALATHGLPEELLAIPLVESGYRNLPQEANPVRAAGIWQFIPATARRYSLTVTDSVDHRLDVTRETEAAMRYLKDLHARFRDWELAVLGYNAGESRVAKGIAETGSRDAWTLIEKGYGNDVPYLSKVIAVAIVLRNPKILR